MSSFETVVPAPAKLWRNELRAMLVLAWPMVLTNLAQTAMTAIDVLIMGRLGPEALSAGVLGANLYLGPMIFGLGLMLATSPMIATEFGRKRHSVRDVRRTARQGFWLAICTAVPVWLLLWHGETFLRMIGQEPALAVTAGQYVHWLQWGLLPFYGYVVLRSFISGLERPGWALVIAFVAVIFNAVAAWALILGRFGMPAMGVPGAGLATSLANFLMFAGLVIVVLVDRRFRRYQLFGRFWRADWPRFIALLKLGLPIGSMLAFEVSLFIAAAFLMGWIDVESVAAHGIAIQIASVSFMVPLGLNQAVTVRVGLAHGARDHDGIFRSGWTAWLLGIGFMAMMALVMTVWPGTLVGFFIDTTNPANATVVKLAVTFLAFAALFQIFDGAQAVASGMLRGLHDTTVPMIIAAIGYWGVGMPLGAVLAFHYGLRGAGIWIGLSAGLAVVALLLLLRWLHRDRILARADDLRPAHIHQAS